MNSWDTGSSCNLSTSVCWFFPSENSACRCPTLMTAPQPELHHLSRADVTWKAESRWSNSICGICEIYIYNIIYNNIYIYFYGFLTQDDHKRKELKTAQNSYISYVWSDIPNISQLCYDWRMPSMAEVDSCRVGFDVRQFLDLAHSRGNRWKSCDS